MFGVAVFNAMLTLSFGFGTLPMPAPGDMWTDINNIAGPRIGNVHTCTAQGFVFDLASRGLFGAVTFLCIYYLLSIVFEIPDKKIQKFEPATYLLCACMILWSTLPPLFNDEYNATYDFPICTSAAKPWFCNEENNAGIDCVRGKLAQISPFLNARTMSIIIIIWVTPLLLVIVFVYISDKMRSMSSKQSKEKTTNQYLLRRRGGNVSRLVQDTSQEDHFYKTKTIAFRALGYFSFVLANLSWLLCIYLDKSQEKPNEVLMVILSIIGYTDGLFILVVFVFHKVHNLKVSNPCMSTKEAIWDVVTNGGVHDAVVITEMDKVLTQYQSISTHNDVPNNDDILVVEQPSAGEQTAPSIKFGFFSYQNANDGGSGQKSAGMSVVAGSIRSQTSTSLTTSHSLGTAAHSLDGSLSYQRIQTNEVEIVAEQQTPSSCDGISYQGSFDGNDLSILEESGLFSIAEISDTSHE